MVNLKSILLDDKRVTGVQLKLPYTLFVFIFHGQGFLCGSLLNIEVLKHNKACICIMNKSSTFEELLTSEVVQMNQVAMKKGIQKGMKGKEALLKMYEN